MTNARENSRTGHVFREGPLRRSRAFWIDGAVLHWRIGRETGHCKLSDIAALDMDPTGGRCLIRLANGQVLKVSDLYWFTWEAAERHRLGSFERRRTTFANFVTELSARLARARTPPTAP